MCALGLYLAFLVLENMLTGNYSTNTTEDQKLAMKAAYNTLRKDMFQRKNLTKRSIGIQNFQVLNISKTPEKIRKKLRVEKVTQKHYEIINMLWRKTKMFIDEGDIYTTTNKANASNMLLHKRKHSSLTFSAPLPPLQTTTTSKIEFYYFDDTQHSVNKRNRTKPYCKSNKMTETTSSLPFLIFHLKGPYVDPIPKSSAERLNHSRFRNNQVRISAIRLKEVHQLTQKVTATPISLMKEIKNTAHNVSARPLQSSLRKDDFFDSNILIKRAILPPSSLNKIATSSSTSTRNTYPYVTKPTTIYDRIKFFETYDKFTRTPRAKKENAIQVTKGNVTDNIEKVLLEHVDQGSHDHIQAKHEKKHITESSFSVNFLNVVTKSKVFVPNDTHKKQPNGTSYFMNGNTKSELNNNNTVFYVNETVRWSEYPFAAVYIYEPSQVHCDAAAINTHWLIASGSCLSRVSKKANFPFEPYGNEGQSAFVTYCCDRWWEPDIVSYVKYTIVHPGYHPRDKTRQHLYNIGAIQVVNPMISACADWAPVRLMTHQFSAKAEMTWATAIGWGLDRFDTRYGATDLPKTHLMAYKSVVYFDSCPGNAGYSKAKRLDEGGGVRNVHCLLLPPYNGEDADPVHGGLLLADGKLIALYLQEERRPWGDQSAQYTGVWRLIPWLMDVAKEPEEIDTVIFEL